MYTNDVTKTLMITTPSSTLSMFEKYCFADVYTMKPNIFLGIEMQVKMSSRYH